MSNILSLIVKTSKGFAPHETAQNNSFISTDVLSINKLASLLDVLMMQPHACFSCIEIFDIYHSKKRRMQL